MLTLGGQEVDTAGADAGTETAAIHKGGLLLIAKMDPFTRWVTEHLDQGVSKYVIATAAAADEVADGDCAQAVGR